MGVVVRPYLGWLDFIAIQMIALILFPIGLLIVGYKAFTREWEFDMKRQQYHWAGWGGHLLWLFDNDEDGIFGPLPLVIVVKNPRWQSFYWCALRNPVNNLRFICSDTHGPFFQKRWKGWYFQAGFRPDTGWPVLSAGRGTGTVL